MNCSRLFALSLFTLISGTALAGNLKVNLIPPGAVTAGAQWRVDGGTWRNSGVTVKNLSNAAHTVEYKAVAGWIAPASTSVTLTNNVTTTITGTYVQPASIAVTLTPSTGQWRIDGGAWRSSGTTATGLTPGAHTISYNALSNYNSPASETVTLVANQTTNLSRSYTAVAALTVTLTPANASWQVDGGSWQSSGATVTGLTPGAHTIAFSSVTGMLPLAPESISLPAAQATSVNRTYTAEAGLIVNLTPATAQWRVDGGAWQDSGTLVGQFSAGNHVVEYNAASGYTAPASESVALISGQTTTITRNYTAVSAVTVDLIPSSGTWQIDGGAWQASGATVTGLTPGNHTIAYSTITGMLPMPSETVSLPGAQTTSLARSYTAEAGLTVTLTPSTAQWRLDGGVWRNSGDHVGQLIAGGHTVDYSVADGYLAPASENVTLVAGQTNTVTRSYTAVSAITVNLSPASGTWQVDGGPWQASGATVEGLTPGAHTIGFSSVAGMLPLAAESISLPAAQATSIDRSYTAEAGLIVNLTPASAQWRVDGGTWQASGTRVGQLSAGNHNVDYTSAPGYAALPSESVALAAGETNTVTRNYTAVSAVTINLTPSSGTWQVDGGPWQASGATVEGLTPGAHTIGFSSVAGMLPMPSETVNLPGTETTSLARVYTAEAGLTVTLTPASAQWRVDGGAWRNSGDRVGQLISGNHLVDVQ